MHTADRAIKIIKREDRDAVEEESDKTEPSLKTQKEIRREILKTITSWIEHQREAKKDLHRLAAFLKRETNAGTVTGGLKTESEPELL